MGTEKICVYIPVEEYRELVQAKRDADCLKALLKSKADTGYGEMKYTELKMVCQTFGVELAEDDA